MKIGIVTITSGTNYGNRLQIYALQQVLTHLGHEPFLIKNCSYAHGIGYRIKKFLKIMMGYHNEREEYKREISYKQFENDWLSISKYTFDEEYLKSNIANHFDAFICGSDQVWNPHFPHLNGGCFADFPGARLRISYAASFGESSIPDYMIDNFKSWLRGMSAISVRENSGVEIVKEIIGKNALVHIDPTLMLDADDWFKLEKAPDIEITKPYIFKYFLGKIAPKISDFIDDVANKNNYDIIDVLPDKKDKNYYLNPSHFLYLIHNADIVITDSFHATVFALLYNKPVRVFDRQDKKLDMTTRLDTLIQLFKCEEVRNNFSLNDLEHTVFVDKAVLCEKRQDAYKYLADSLDSRGEK